MALLSCSKEDVLQKKETVPEGWTSQKQIIIINQQGYDIEVASNPKTNEIMYLNEPKEVTDFFNQYDETFIPHIVNGLNNEVLVFFYKDWNDYKDHIKMMPYDSVGTKRYNGGETKSYEHLSYYSNHLIQKMLTYKWFDFNSVKAWGQSNSYVGNSLNDKISLVTIHSYDYQNDMEWMHYMGCQHSNWGGRRFIITFVGNSNYPILQSELSYIPFTKLGARNWNDRISSCESWQAWYNPPHWNNPIR